MKKVLTAIILTSIIFVNGCNNAEHGDPKTVLRAFFDAMSKQDWDGAKKYATVETGKTLDMLKTFASMGGTKKENDLKYDKDKMEFGEPRIEGDKATITVKEKGSTDATDMILKKENGNWKVAFDKATMMNMGADKVKGNINSDSVTNKININLDSIKNKMKDATKEVEDASKTMDSVVSHH